MVPKRLGPKRLGTKRIGIETTRGQNVRLPNFMNPYRSFRPFCSWSPSIFIENMIARMTKETLTLENPGSKIYGKTTCIRKFNNILSSRDNSAMAERKLYSPETAWFNTITFFEIAQTILIVFAFAYRTHKR